MKPCCIRFLTIFFMALPVAQVWAEEGARRGAKAEVMQFVGTTPIIISYSSPGVKGRKVWGELNPFGKNWIAGANEKTTITFEEDVKINGNDLAAGVYGFYVFLNSDDDWQLVFSGDSTPNATQFDKADDVLRIAVAPQDAPHRERLQFGIEDFTDKKPYQANLYLHWERKKVAVKVQMTGRRRRETRMPEIPENAKAAWAVVQSSLNALVAEDIEESIRDFSDDFETDFGDGGGKAAYAQLMNNLKRGGLLEEMETNLNDLAVDVDGNKVVFKNIEVRAPFDTFSLSYVLENRDGRWVVTALADAVAEAPPKPDAVRTRGRPASARRFGFEKIVLTPRYYCDGIHTGDINRDGHADVVAGPYWYAGPEFTAAHEFYPAKPLLPEKSPSNSMFSFVHDFNDDRWPDILVLGRVHLHPAYWYENPGDTDRAWRKHYAFERVQGESPTLVDLDGDGRPQLVCHWDGRWGWIEPRPEAPAAPWRFHPISDRGEWKEFYHGTGVGDLNGDRRLDLVINDGWFIQPPKPNTVWTWHAHRFSLGRGGAQMLVYDVDGDGDSDVVSSLDAHGWGLAWFEQYSDQGNLAFRMHPIMGTRQQIDRYGVAFSQPHALDLGDIDGDGLKDLVVGKRMWAHGPTGDVEPGAPPVLYWFELQREDGVARFKPHLIDDRSGVGVQVTIADMNGDGANDILSASKLGSFVFINQLGQRNER